MLTPQLSVNSPDKDLEESEEGPVQVPVLVQSQEGREDTGELFLVRTGGLELYWPTGWGSSDGTYTPEDQPTILPASCLSILQSHDPVTFPHGCPATISPD